MLRSVIVTYALVTFAAPAAFARNCTKGKPCGNSCIAKGDVCHKGAGSASLSSEAPAAPAAAEAAPAAKVKTCKKGKPCGNTCIPADATCHQ